MAFSVIGRWGEKGATIIRILDYDKSQQIRSITWRLSFWRNCEVPKMSWWTRRSAKSMFALDFNQPWCAVNWTQNQSWWSRYREGFCEECLPGQTRRAEQVEVRKEGLRRSRRKPSFRTRFGIMISGFNEWLTIGSPILTHQSSF